MIGGVSTEAALVVFVGWLRAAAAAAADDDGGRESASVFARVAFSHNDPDTSRGHAHANSSMLDPAQDPPLRHGFDTHGFTHEVDPVES